LTEQLKIQIPLTPFAKGEFFPRPLVGEGQGEGGNSFSSSTGATKVVCKSILKIHGHDKSSPCQRIKIGEAQCIMPIL